MEVKSESLKRPMNPHEDIEDNKKVLVTSDDKNCDGQNISGFETTGLSKSQLKKLKKKEMWQKSKSFRRAKEKERLRQKRIDAKLNNIPLGPSRKMLKNSKMSTSNCKVSVVIDTSFDELMDDRSLGKCNKQMLHCYSMNRRAANPMQLYFTSLSGKSLAEMAKHDGYLNWDVNIHSEHFTEVFPPERLVYLSSESTNMLDTLQDDKVYIIGGLVDHNAHKGHCWEVAKKLGIQHAQLPISNYLEMKTRQVLTIDHVFAIMLHVTEGLSWKDALLQVMPQRKGARERDELKPEKSSKLEQSEEPNDSKFEQEPLDTISSKDFS